MRSTAGTPRACHAAAVKTPVPSTWRPPTLWPYRSDARRWQLLGAWQYRADMQPSRCAAWATVHIKPGHPGHKGSHRLGDPRVDDRHLQGQARSTQLDRLAARSEYPVVANALETAGQHMLQDAAHELHARQPDGAFSAMCIGADLQGNVTLADR